MTHKDDNQAVQDSGVAANLYRSEALAAATTRFGSPVRPLGVSALVLTGFFLALLISVAVFLTVGRYSRKETVSGIIQPSTGSANVTTLSAGVISDVYVTDGQYVVAGSPILRFTADPSISQSDNRFTPLSGLIAEGARREEQALFTQSQASLQANVMALADVQAKRDGLNADRIELGESVALQSERVRLSQETLDAGRALNDRQLFSNLQLRQREEALIAAKQGLSALEREIRQNAALLDQVAAEEGRLRAQMTHSQAEMARAKAQFDQRRAEQMASEAAVLVAPRSGLVVAMQARPGSTAQPGQTLAVILPRGATLNAELWVPSRAIGFVQVGSKVRLMYDAFPYQKFGVGLGEVISMAGAPTNPSDLSITSETSEAMYRVLVKLDHETIEGYGKKWRLTPGMRLSADMVLDERSFWEWLLDPFIAAQRRAQH